MGKVILLLLLGVAFVVWVLGGYRRRLDRSTERPPAEGEKMVRCAQCGLHLPASESVSDRGLHFCSTEHRRVHGEARSGT